MHGSSSPSSKYASLQHVLASPSRPLLPSEENATTAKKRVRGALERETVDADPRIPRRVEGRMSRRNVAYPCRLLSAPEGRFDPPVGSNPPTVFIAADDSEQAPAETRNQLIRLRWLIAALDVPSKGARRWRTRGRKTSARYVRRCRCSCLNWSLHCSTVRTHALFYFTSRVRPFLDGLDSRRSQKAGRDGTATKNRVLCWLLSPVAGPCRLSPNSWIGFSCPDNPNL
jgi:hypothetical protein